MRPLTVGELLWFPLVVLVQLSCHGGMALILSALTVHFRDIRDILSNVLTLWFFATPIIYPYLYAPDVAKRYMNLNPFTHLAISYQEILFFPARSVTGSGCSRSAQPRSCFSWSATGVRSPA